MQQAHIERMKQRLASYMEAESLKSTRQRDTIADVFFAAGVHLNLDEVLQRAQEQMPGLGYATVYRTMKLLVAAGVAEERHFGEGQTLYELADDVDDHHDHLICRTCGHIFEFEDPEIEARQALVANRHGLRIVAHRLDLWGECEAPVECAYRKSRQGA